MLHWTVHQKLPSGAIALRHRSQGVAVVSVRKDIYIFGGSSVFTVDQNPVNILNTVTLCWTTLPPVANRKGKSRCGGTGWYRHNAVLIEDIVYVCEGFAENLRSGNKAYIYKNKLHTFDVCTHRWFKPEVSGTVPKLRGGHSACAIGEVMYIYGGEGYDDNNIYKLDTSTMVWTVIIPRGNLPGASAWHSAIAIGTKMFVVGGNTDGKRVRVFDTETNFWLRPPSAPNVQLLRNEDHSAFGYKGELYIFGKLGEK